MLPKHFLIIYNSASEFRLVPWKIFCVKWESRPDLYFHSDITGQENTFEHVGWAVCKFVKEGVCDIADGIKNDQPKVGNSSFHLHVILQTQSGYDKDKRIRAPVDRRKIILDSASKAAIMDRNPFKL